MDNIRHGYYCGVDPGAKGAIVELCYAGEWSVHRVIELKNYDFSKLVGLANLGLELANSNHWKTATAIERVQGMPRQSGPASFNFGRNFGALLGFLVGRYHASLKIMPKSAWAFLVGIPFDKRDDKKAAVELAVRLVPDLAKYKNRLGNVPDGIAEAALIAIAAAIQESKQNALS